MTATIPTIGTEGLTYDAKRRMFVTEASSDNQDLSGMMYRDLFAGAMPAAIRVRSHVTGRLVKFDYKELRRDREGEIIAWVYTCGQFNTTLHILND